MKKKKDPIELPPTDADIKYRLHPLSRFPNDIHVVTFPVEAFPKSIQKIIYETNVCQNFPIDFIGTALLYAASIAIGNTFRVQARTGWTESAVLYFALVGNPNTAKTPALTFATKPISELEVEYEHQYQKELAEYNNLPSEEKKPSEKPKRKVILIADATVESVVQVLSENERGIGLCMDELFGWIQNFSRYNGGNDSTFWISNWSTKKIRVDRKTSGHFRINKPFISVAGGVQTGILYEFTKNNQMKNGMFDRILFAAPNNLTKLPWSKKQLNPEIPKLWNKILRQLLTLEFTKNEVNQIMPTIIQFSEGAYKTIEEWELLNTELCNKTMDKLQGPDQIDHLCRSKLTTSDRWKMTRVNRSKLTTS